MLKMVTVRPLDLIKGQVTVYHTLLLVKAFFICSSLTNIVYVYHERALLMRFLFLLARHVNS